MRRSIRVAYIFALTAPAICSAAVSSQAQSLSDAQASFAGLTSPPAPAAPVAAAVGTWSTVTAADPPKPAAAAPQFDHWQAKITFLKPSFAAQKKAATPTSVPITHSMDGLASYYGKGKLTATGETFNPADLTAAHRTLPFGTRVRVTRVDTGQSIIVRINDRGPFKPGRVIDLSQRAAEDLRITDKGLAAVKLEVVDRDVPGSALPAPAPEPHLVENVAQRSLRR